MEHPTRNYLFYTLASFVIFFDVLMCARTIFTETLPVILYLVYIALLLGLFLAWRVKDFERRARGYGFLFAILMFIANLINHHSPTFWLVFIVNVVIFGALILLSLVWRPREPLIEPLAFAQATPRIEQALAKKFREKLKIDAADKVLLLYGPPTRAKQFSLALATLPIITNLCPGINVKLLITTWGETDGEVNRLKRLAKNLEIVAATRFIKTTDPEHLKYILNLANIIIFPYRNNVIDPTDLNAALPYLKALVVPDSHLFAQLVNEKNCLKVKNITDKKELALTIERLIKDEKLMMQLGYSLAPHQS